MVVLLHKISTFSTNTRGLDQINGGRTLEIVGVSCNYLMLGVGPDLHDPIFYID